MCGIAGIVCHDPSQPVDREAILTMRDVMPYRGPDDSGIFVDGPAALGFRRLSIIDLSGGHQPMPGVNNRRWIVFNGEIYNYRTLRQELAAAGYRFKTHSDTEVILALYETRGEACVEALNGMFAFAIWDADARSLFLARDRMGVKPLYYAESNGVFAFASEMKSLFASGVVTPTVREEALSEYLLFRQVAGPHTLFRGVNNLLPGHTMTVRDSRVTTRRYWSPLPSADPAPIEFDDAVRRLGELLEDSVRLRLISDVPVGTFCSGGVDSSLVTALASKLKGEPVNTYSVGFEDLAFDESPFALAVSKQYGTNHHRLEVSHADFSNLLPKMIWHNDEPLDFANSIHIFALSRLAKQDVTVVLTGEGSDELFAGYPRYRIPGLAAPYRHVPAPLRRLASAISGDHRLAKLDRYAAMDADDALLYNASYVSPALAAELAPDLPPFDDTYRQACLDRTARLGLDGVGRASLLDQETFLVGILLRQDKMSMAASIESRVPFMDYRVVEFANRLPTACKIRGASGKAVVKALARTLLPAEIVDRRKSGFGVPLAQWLRTSEGLGERLLELPEHPAAEMFDSAVLRRVIDEHRSGANDHSELLWTALNVCGWREVFHC